MRMKKRILSLVFCFVMYLSLLPIGAFTENIPAEVPAGELTGELLLEACSGGDTVTEEATDEEPVEEEPVEEEPADEESAEEEPVEEESVEEEPADEESAEEEPAEEESADEESAEEEPAEEEPAEEEPAEEEPADEEPAEKVSVEKKTVLQKPLLSLGGAPNGPTNVVPDPKFKAYLNGILGHDPDADITEDDLKRITKIDTSGISDLEGVQYCTELTFFRVYGTPDNLQLVGNCKKLTFLAIMHSRLEDISFVSGLTELTYIDFYNDDIKDISALKNLTKLTVLDLMGNCVLDMSPLSGFYQQFTHLYGLYQEVTLTLDCNREENGYCVFDNPVKGIDGKPVAPKSASLRDCVYDAVTNTLRTPVGTTEFYFETSQPTVPGSTDFQNNFDTYVTVKVNHPPKIGNLAVSKTVAGNAADSGKEFIFTVTLGDTSVSGAYGGMSFANGVATFALKGGESITATALPAGTAYTVTEADYSAEGYVTAKTGDTGTIADGQTSTAAFTNTKNIAPPPPPPPQPTGNLTVTKTIAGNAADSSKVFSFTVTLGDTSVSGAYGGMSFANGVATFALKGGESITATALPAGTAYTVTEADYSAEGYVTAKTGDTGTIADGQTSTATFTNTKNITPPPPPPPQPKNGNLTISKNVTGDLADKTRYFTFRVEFDRDGAFSYSGSRSGTLASGGSIELKHGESVTIFGIPAGTHYTVTESGGGGYSVYASGNSGIISEGDTALAKFTNTRSSVPQTGDDSSQPLWFSIMGISLLGMAGSLFIKEDRHRKPAHLRNR